MLYFARKPDLVFTAILHTALESEGESIKSFVNNDLDLWEACYPESSRYFTATSSFDVLTQLFCASRDPIVYRLTDYHWLLLYEVLQNFCVVKQGRFFLVRNLTQDFPHKFHKRLYF